LTTLAQGGTDVNTLNANGQTPLYAAVTSQDLANITLWAGLSSSTTLFGISKQR